MITFTEWLKLLSEMTDKEALTYLGLNKIPDEKELKSAYRKAAMKWHPDRNVGNDQAEDMFKKSNMAYEYLKDRKPTFGFNASGTTGWTKPTAPKPKPKAKPLSKAQQAVMELRKFFDEMLSRSVSLRRYYPVPEKINRLIDDAGISSDDLQEIWDDHMTHNYHSDVEFDPINRVIVKERQSMSDLSL